MRQIRGDAAGSCFCFWLQKQKQNPEETSMSGALPLLGGHRRDRSGLALVALALCAVALIAASASWAQVAAPDRLAVAVCEQAFEAPCPASTIFQRARHACRVPGASHVHDHVRPFSFVPRHHRLLTGGCAHAFCCRSCRPVSWCSSKSFRWVQWGGVP